MNLEEIDYWLKFFCNKPICYKSGEDKEISFAKVFMEFKELQQENKQLKEKIEDLELNWEIIKQYCLDEQIPEEYDEYNSYIEFSNSVYDDIFNKMENLESEQGSDK